MRLGEAPPQPTAGLVALVEGGLGAPATAWRKPHTGLSPAQRFVVTLADGRSCFVKASVDAETERMLRNEHRVLGTVRELAPEVLAWIENGVESALVTEDLSGAYWPADHARPDGQPVRYGPGQVDALLDALERVAAKPALDLPPLSRSEPEWPLIGVDPAPFLALGICGAEWLARNIDGLVAAEAALDLSGNALVHNDVRSDNVCFRGEQVLLVDWSNPRRGPEWFDRATLALTLPLETEMQAHDIAPDAGAYAAWQAAVLARRSSTDAAPPWLLRVFARMSSIALHWVCASYGIEPPDGPNWRQL